MHRPTINLIWLKTFCLLLFYFIITIIAFTIFKIQFSTFILSRFGRDLVLGGTSCMLEAHKAITKRNFFIYFVFMSTTGQEVGLITGCPSSVWEFNQIHGVSYCVILKMAVNKKDQCCMGIQVNSRRQILARILNKIHLALFTWLVLAYCVVISRSIVYHFFALSLSRVSDKYDLYIAISKRLAVFAGTVLILPFFSVTLSSTIEGPLIRLKWIKAEVDWSLPWKSATMRSSGWREVWFCSCPFWCALRFRRRSTDLTGIH